MFDLIWHERITLKHYGLFGVKTAEQWQRFQETFNTEKEARDHINSLLERGHDISMVFILEKEDANGDVFDY
jgi:hypothetical protein